MDIKRFPLLLPQSSVTSALARMRSEAVSGVLVSHDRYLELVGYGELIGRRVPGSAHLEALNLGHRIPVVGTRDIDRFGLEAAAGRILSPDQSFRLQRYLDEVAVPLAGFGVEPNSALVLSSSELFLQPYTAAPLDCYCENPVRQHGYSHSDHPETCIFCPYKVICQ